MDGTLDVIHRMDRVIFELLCEITMIRANYSKGLRKSLCYLFCCTKPMGKK